MVKYNISDKGKAWRIESQDEALSGKSVGDEIQGKEISADLEGYTLKITGGSDNAGFPLSQNTEGIGLRKVLLKEGWGMRDSTEGLKRRKTVRGKTISNTTSQINLVVIKAGNKHLAEVFPDQNKPKEEPKKEAAPVPETA